MIVVKNKQSVNDQCIYDLFGNCIIYYWLDCAYNIYEYDKFGNMIKETWFSNGFIVLEEIVK